MRGDASKLARALVGCILVCVAVTSCNSSSALERAGERAALASLLADCRSASNWDAVAASTLHVRGRSLEQGLPGAFELCFDAHGRFRVTIASALGGSAGFDGTTCWALDELGVGQPVHFGARAQSLCARWVQSGHWASADQTTFSYELLARDADSIRLAMRHTSIPFVAHLTLDARTLLPRELVQAKTTGTRSIIYSDWRATTAGLRLSHRQTVIDVAGDETLFELTEVARMETCDYAFPGSSSATAVFDPARPAQLEARRAASGQLLVHPRLNGRDVGWFLLDSGAGSVCIDAGVADELGLRTYGEVSVSGVGGSVLASYRGGAQLQAGPLSIDDLAWLELDLEFLTEAFGLRVAGVLGYEFFARAIVVLDLAEELVEVHASISTLGSTLGSALTWSELRFDGRIPCARARFEGQHEAWFRIDSGSDETVIFHAPAVRQFGLLRGRDTARAMLGGVGGSHSLERGRLDWFELGNVRFDNLRVGFFGGGASLLATPYQAGNIGSGLLSSFRVVWDYARGRVAWIPK